MRLETLTGAFEPQVWCHRVVERASMACRKPAAAYALLGGFLWPIPMHVGHALQGAMLIPPARRSALTALMARTCMFRRFPLMYAVILTMDVLLRWSSQEC